MWKEGEEVSIITEKMDEPSEEIEVGPTSIDVTDERISIGPTSIDVTDEPAFDSRSTFSRTTGRTTRTE